MGSCGKHNDVECRFFCNTCGIPVCHVCMEKGDHVVSIHDCVPVTQYCETKSNGIRSVLEEATKHKIRCDKLNLKWDMHLSGVAEEFDKVKNEILLTKQHLLQQLDLDEQLQLKAAAIEKTKLETAIKFVQCHHSETFCGLYQQLNEKSCQFLLRNPSSHNSEENETVFEQCRKLTNNLQEVLTRFEKEELLGINMTFVPSKYCFLGKVVVPRDVRCLTDPALDTPISTVSAEPSRKRKCADSDPTISPLNKENAAKVKNEVDKSIKKNLKTSTPDTNAKQDKQDDISECTPVVQEKRSNNEDSKTRPVNTNVSESSKDGNFKSILSNDVQQASLPLSTDKPPHLLGTLSSPHPHAGSVAVRNGQLKFSRQHLTVDTCCSGIGWADKDWLFEVTKFKTYIKVIHHKISDGSQLPPDIVINCNEAMDDKEIRVCPKLHSPNCSFLVAFKDHIATISLKDMKLQDVSWQRIPNTFALLAISWRKRPSNYVAIVKGPDGQVGLIRNMSEDATSLQFELKPLSSIAASCYQPLDISSNDEIAVCNTFTGKILFFGNFEELVPTRQVLAPTCLTGGTPLCVSCVDDRKEWLALWKGHSVSDGFPKWVIVRYNSSFISVSTIIQNSYRKVQEEPKAFCVRRHQIAVLYNSLKVTIHTAQSEASSTTPQ